MCWLVEEAIDPDSIKGFGQVEENCTGEPVFSEIPDYSFNEAGQLQGCAVPGSKPKLLVLHQSAFAYYIKILASRIFSNNLPFVSNGQMAG